MKTANIVHIGSGYFACVAEHLSFHSEELERKIAGLPALPGVYMHRDSAGTILYIGKAKNLRNRVRAYFQEGKPTDAKTRVLVSKIADVDIIVTDTEAEALLLENTLIKEHRPKYNILLKDDKSYPYIRITKEPFPRVFKTRRVVHDGSKYFGPYADGTYLYNLLKALRSILPLRNCDLPLKPDSIAAGKFKVCLEYHIKKCDGPCEGLISQDQYAQYIKQAQQILNGKTDNLEQQLYEQMMQLATDLRFEDAAVVRSRLEILREYVSRQKVMSADNVDRDVFGIARIARQSCLVVLTIRSGKLVGKRHFFLQTSLDVPDAEIIRTAMEQWYVDQESIPGEVFIPTEIEEAESLTDFLSAKAQRTVSLVIPRIGEKRRLLEMAEKNADYLLRELLVKQAQKDQSMPRAVLSLQRDLRLDRLPKRIECFDNSHMQGTDYVSSMVVFVDGKPRPSEYRTFKLHSVEGNDDFAAMREVVLRRYSGSLQNLPHPDLCIIDGGKGQVHAAMQALRAIGLEGAFPVIGLAKRLEEVFLPGQSDSVLLPRTSSSLRLLQQARDEAHRVAVSYHRKLRNKRTLETELTIIPGVGKATATRLLIKLGSVDAVKNASVESLQEIVGPALAKKIYEYYRT